MRSATVTVLAAVGVVVAAAGVLVLLPSGPPTARYRLAIRQPGGEVQYEGPAELTEEQALNWQLDAQEGSWNALVTRYRWDVETADWVAV